MFTILYLNKSIICYFADNFKEPMTDVHEPAVRSYNMSQIRSKNTKPELIVRKFLFKNGFRYRIHSKGLPGKPDIVLPKYKTVIFVNGCFWHGHDKCKYYVKPKTRNKYWLNKIEMNKKRDIENIIKLENEGWRIQIIWECQLKNNKKILEELVHNIANYNPD